MSRNEQMHLKELYVRLKLFVVMWPCQHTGRVTHESTALLCWLQGPSLPQDSKFRLLNVIRIC